MEKKKGKFGGREIELRTFTYGDYFDLKSRGEQINLETSMMQVISLEDAEFIRQAEFSVELSKELAVLIEVFASVNPKLKKKEDDSFLEQKPTGSGETKSG